MERGAGRFVPGVAKRTAAGGARGRGRTPRIDEIEERWPVGRLLTVPRPPL
jgi:hypothetical protein